LKRSLFLSTRKPKLRRRC